jgi:hypothetical protein
MTTAAATSTSGWNFILAALTKRVPKHAVLASVLAIRELRLRALIDHIASPTAREANAMRRLLHDLDSPKFSPPVRMYGPRGAVGVDKRLKPRMKLRTAERPKFGYPKRLYTRKGWRAKGQK